MNQTLRRPGRCQLRTSLADHDSDPLWRYYLKLVFVEEVFCALRDHPGLRPVFNRKVERIESHLFVTLLTSCL